MGYRWTEGSPGGSGGKESACPCRMWVRSLGEEDPLEEEMATHSSILAWRIPWTEEPGGLQSMGSQRVGHNLATEQQQMAVITLMYSSSSDGSEWVRDELACVTSRAFERHSSTYRVSDLHSTPMMSPMDSFPRERIITSGTCHGISWFCIHNITSIQPVW